MPIQQLVVRSPLTKAIIILHILVIVKMGLVGHKTTATSVPLIRSLVDMGCEKAVPDVDELVTARIEFWNTQPVEERYHVADIKYPFSRSCMCYASWHNISREEACDAMEQSAAANGKPFMSIAITDSWFRDFLCASRDVQAGLLGCPASNCRFSLVSGNDVDYSAYDGLLQYSGDIMPTFSRPNNVPWFRAGYIGAEPEDAHATLETYQKAGYDMALSYRLPKGMEASLYSHTLLLDFPEDYFRRFDPGSWTQRRLDVGSIISHCVPERTTLLEELGRHVQIDQYGGCGKSKDLDVNLPQCRYRATSASEGDDEPRWIEQRCIIGHYKFYLAFENSQHDGYVTEKLWQALFMGAIPVYWGASNIRKFLPAPDAVIHASDFESPRALADYIKFLLASPGVAYEKHLRWRTMPFPSSFRRIFDASIGGAACRLCDYIAEIKHGTERESHNSYTHSADDSN